MKFPESTLRPHALGRGQISRSNGLQVRAAARQSPSNTSKKGSISREEQVVETVEVAALTAAAAAAGGLALSRSLNLTAQSQKGQAPQARTAASTGTPSASIRGDTNLEVLFITGPIFIAVAARSLAARLARRRAEATPAAQAMARLASAETALSKQADSLSILTRQVDKVQIRTRLVSRDLRDQIKEIQALTETHNELLLGAGDKLAQVERQVRGLEELVDAVQGIAAKQFRLIASVVGQGSKTVAPVGGTSTNKKTHSSSYKINKKNEPATVVVSELKEPPLAAAITRGSGKDEWGRAVTSSQSLQSKKEEEKESESEVAAGEVEEETPAVAVISIDDGRHMQLNDDGSVSFTF